MPTEQSAKNNKSKKFDKTKIKTETTTESHSLSHYIDDRPELLNQIFATLKSKTIKSIAPAFLQDKSLDSIQKHCLEELVGISKKRLLSIINSTKCPTDTESSDSDVENIEEHISLEEISSDSEAEKAAGRKKKTKSKGKQQTNKKSSTTEDNNKPPKKEVSVLELLELQARARAIRSQLALEPVTKIELDSDNETSSEVSTSKPSTMIKTFEEPEPTPQPPVTPQTSSSSQLTVKKPTENNGTEKVSTSQIQKVVPTKTATTTTKTPSPPKPVKKPIRLKRNFRQRQMDGYDEDADADEPSNQQRSPTISHSSTNDKSQENDLPPDVESSNDRDKRSVSRCSSPDVITIIPSPETLLISSDSDGESSPKKSNAVHTIVNTPGIVQLPETEDECFLRKIKEANGAIANANDSSNSNSMPLPSDENNKEETTGENTVTKNNNNDDSGNDNENDDNDEGEDDELREPEDGEIFESDDDDVEVSENNKSSAEMIEKNVETESQEKENQTASVESKSAEQKSSTDKCEEDTSKNLEKINESGATIDDNDDDDDESIASIHEITENSSSSSSSSESESEKTLNPVTFIDDDEDIIDLGKDEDFEMKIVSDDEIETIPAKKTKKRNSKNKDIDEDKEQQETEIESESWGTRWLRGTKVTKIMATSKLANKVRSKIKKQKKDLEASAIAAAEAEEAEKLAEIEREKMEQIRIENENAKRLAGLEEGSVKQYEVLKDSSTDNDNNQESENK